ncbi:MAG: hypothetical protein GQ527_08670 [Bacteroidales bacterium]|nr:hypothetical protein [Bacteroidales bacterium]
MIVPRLHFQCLLWFDAQALGIEVGMPDVGDSVSIRYAFWFRLHIQLTGMR